jgi:hypothetical protein
MGQQITHRRDPDTGRMVQIVSPRDLRRILRRNGESTERPKDFRPDDEWNVEG